LGAKTGSEFLTTIVISVRISAYMKLHYQSRVGLRADRIAIPDLAGTETRPTIISSFDWTLATRGDAEP
jgi:hypothetical protein